MTVKAKHMADYTADGSGDWTPAVLQALTDLGHGGTVHFDADMEMKSQLNWTPTGDNHNVVFQGNHGNTVKINAGNSHAIFNLGNMVQAMFRDVPFIGKQKTAGGAYDCAWVIYANTENTIVDNCHFAGVYAAQSLINQHQTGDVHVLRSKFGGNGHVGSAVECNGGMGMFIEGCEFYDFDQLFGGYDRQGARGQWLKAYNGPDYSTQSGGAASVGMVSLKHNRFDEGAGGSLVVDGYQHVVVEQCASNTSSAPIGFNLSNVRWATFLGNQVGYGNAGSTLIGLTNCGDVFVDSQGRGQTNYNIDVDAATRLTVVRSPDVVIDAAAGAHYSFNGIHHTATGVTQVGP